MEVIKKEVKWVGKEVIAKVSDVRGRVIGIADVSNDEYKRWFEGKYDYKIEEEPLMLGLVSKREGKLLIVNHENTGLLELMYEGEVRILLPINEEVI